jgi:hypothetical protein
MKTLLLIVSKIQKGDSYVRLTSLKKEIIKYVGTRMLDDDMDGEDAPAILLNYTLNKEEKEHIAKLCTSDDHIVFIEGTEDSFKEACDQYIDCMLMLNE